MDIGTLRAITVVAVWVMVYLGAALTLAVAWAGTMPAHGPVKRTATKAWAWARWRLYVPLRAFAVTFLHTYRSDKATSRPQADGRHARGFGRTLQGPGRHRACAA